MFVQILVTLFFSAHFCSANVVSRESFRLSENPKIHVQLKITQKSKNDTQALPVVFLFGGFQEAAHVLDLIQSPRPVMLVSFDYPYDAPRKFRFPESIKELPRVKNTILDTRDAISLVLDELLKRKDVNPKRVSIIGASLGAPFAVMAASRDSRFKGLVLLHGFAKVEETIAFQFERKWKQWGWLASALSWCLAKIAWTYVGLEKIEDLAPRLQAHQEVLLIHAQSDEFLPPGASESLSSSIKASKAHVTEQVMSGGHLGPGANQQIQQMLRRVENWMLKYNLW